MNNLRPRYWLPVADTVRMIVAIVLVIIIILLLLRACSPAAPTLVGPAAGAQSGQPVDLTGVAAPNAVVRVLDGSALIGETTADASGNWKLALPAGLGAGPHELTAQVARDKQVASSAPLSLNIAARPPTLVPTSAPTPTAPPSPTAPPTATQTPRPTQTPIAPVISAPSAGAVLTADKPGDVVGLAAPGSKVQVMDGDKLLGEVTADSSGKWIFGLPSPLLAGTHALKSIVLDANGKEAARSPVVSIEIKAVEAPTILPLANGQLSIGSVVKGKARPGSVVSIFNGDTLLGTATAGADGAWEFILPASLQAGAANLRAALLNSAGAVLAQSDTVRVQIVPAMLPASGGAKPGP
jgi:hypothetical protein